MILPDNSEETITSSASKVPLASKFPFPLLQALRKRISTMTLRAYITGTQISQVKLGQGVKVFVDDGPDKYKELPGMISWIADKAEFTPKTIQTKDERANLVYAIKVKVKNDGYLKIGMYGEVKFSQ